MVRPGIQLMTSCSADWCSSNLAYRAAVNLIAVDYFSNFWEIDRLRDTKASTCVCELNSQFPRNGIPDVVISDNGPQFTSSEFAQFGREWGFEHKTSSPGHQQAFVQAESAVKTAKSIFRKAKKSKSDRKPCNTCSTKKHYRIHVGLSPGLVGRPTKTQLPITAELLKQQHVNTEDINKRIKMHQQK